MIEASNLSHKEYFRLNGALSVERTEAMFEEVAEAQAYDVREFADYAIEAQCGFSDEDFLQDEVSDLYAFAKRLRGDNKKDLLSIIEAIENALQQHKNSVEFGYEQLNKIISPVKKV